MWVFACTRTHAHTQTCEEENHVYLLVAVNIFFEIRPLTCLELSSSALLASQWSSAILLSLPMQVWDHKPTHHAQLFFLDVCGCGAQSRPSNLHNKQFTKLSCLLSPEFYSFKWSHTNVIHTVQSLEDMNLLLLQKTWVHFPARTLGGSTPL